MPINIEQNNLSLLNFKFRLERTPDIEYRAQSLTLPGRAVDETEAEEAEA